ncbi:hypothetical protein [Bosea sp. (in: a-proteobacteria)]|uniref:hypothetical protein n=1 Tax=Bosea sp. (in: a-proteobacteria) TaxID=1871050 RepID=UPI00262732BD|nr:hypothetical protein [Bosea sp. (in: a-proteobacteria)]MCO5089786.1 hypothetical protein [Bosea sp. (in: a-proteobacteria)]
MTGATRRLDGVEPAVVRVDGGGMSAQNVIRLGVALVASGASLALSWPYWRDFEYWAESRSMWTAYFVVGFILAVYVFYVFFGSLATLFEHDALERKKQPSCGCGCGEAAGTEDAP